VMTSRFGVGNSSFRTGGEAEREVDTVGFGCWPGRVFEQFGLFDERLVRNQDIEYNNRIRRGGGRIVISPDIRLTYFCPATCAGMMRQAFRNGLWNPYTIYAVGHGLGLRHFAPLFAVLTALALAVGGFFWSLWWMLLAGAGAAYGALAIAAAIPAARKTDVSWPRVTVTFPLLHAAYGMGSLCGVLSAPVRFGLRPRRPRPREGKPQGAPL